MKKNKLVVLGAGLIAAAIGFFGTSIRNETRAARAETTNMTISQISAWYGAEWCSFNLDPFDTYLYDNCAGKNYVATDGTLTYNSTEGGNTVFHANGAGGNLRIGQNIYNAHSANNEWQNMAYLSFTFYDGVIGSSDVLCVLSYGADPNVDAVTLDKDSATIAIGATTDLTATSNSSDLTWSSDDTDVATVAGNGKTAVVTGVAAGTATITVEFTSDSSIFATCEITVTESSATKLGTPVGVVVNQIGDGGKLVAFGAVANASSYKAVFHGSDDSVVETPIGNGETIRNRWSGLTDGVTYTIGVIAVGDGVNYSNSDESARASVSYTCFKSGESYANYFLTKTNVCDNSGVTFNINENIWNDLKGKYDDVFYAERQDFKNKTTTASTNAIARYDYILGKYSLATYSWLTDFAATGATRPAANSLLSFAENNSSYSIIIIVAAASVVAGAGIIFASKKRKVTK